ncbi:MAG: universal stress protein [Bacteroidetes bacterium]|jgi:nucleotide-binding universal stress UspA family protein|nr:universal stress protein [Bacteroidota bacterium]
MIKRILVALDPGEDTPVAIRYAAALAQRHGATVSGLAVIDTKHIATSVGPGGAIGGMYYAGLSRQHMTEQARETARDLLHRFDTALEQAGVRHGERVEEGVPVQQVIDDMRYHDLLVIGGTSHFFYDRPEQETNTLAQIVKRAISPTLVVDSTYRNVQRTLLAYDGSNASARTLQRFAQLKPFGGQTTVEIVHVRAGNSQREHDASDLLLHQSAAFLRAHGFERVVETSRDGGKPGDCLIEHADHIEADLLVAGAHSVSAMRRMAFGSTTHTLLANSVRPLFLFH